uniref:ankyrin repeat domain-containing protein 31 n=1 Tax=Jaculus jaculus TaxID=51337 RepID=UPI001E1AF73A|nr:ankyrin repeat domain-containing protein 31 [Jaculus jaculus]
MEEEGAAASDSDSDETIIEGSVTDSDEEGEALHWRRLYFDQDTSLRPEFSFHPGTNGMGQGLSSPEIPLGLTLRKDSQEQKNKSDVMPILSEDTILQTIEDPKPFGLQILTHENVISSEPLNNEGNSNAVKNTSVLKTPCILRRSSRLEKLKADRDAKHIDDTCKMTETILLKTLSCENQINKSSTKNFRIQDSVLMDKGKGKTMPSSRFKSDQIRKNERLLNEKRKMNKLCPATINRRNIFGENLLYMAALRDDVELVRCCIKNGGNVNQQSYAGWTALHEVCVGGFYRTASELLKGGADVNIKGMYQITPLHDAVINGHHKVVELLLLNGADPLLRNENGKCALDEAKDSCMRDLLEKYIRRHKKHRTSARRKTADPAHVEDVYQFKKPKFSYKDCSCFVCDENSNRQKPEHVTINKRNKGLLINKSDIYEYYQENSNTTEFGKSKNKESTVSQTCSMGHRKGYLYNFRDSRTNVSKTKGKRNLKKHEKSQDSQVDEEYYNSRQTAISSSVTVDDKSVTHQQFTVQSLDDFREESFGFSTPTLSSLKNGLGNNSEACSVSKELHTLDLSDSQEIQSLELKSIDQTEVSLFSLHKETVLPLVTTEDLLDIPQKQCNSHYKSLENSCTYKKSKNLNKQENSFQSFTKDQVVNDDVDFSTSEKTITSVTQLCYTEGENHSNYQENVTNVEEMDSQGSLPSEDHHSQKNELKAGSLTTLSQQEDVHFYDSDSTVISEQHAANCGQCIYETPFDHSHVNPKQTSLPCIRRVPSTYEVSKITSHMEMFKKLQDNDLRGQTPSVNQTEAHNVEKEQDTERNYTVTDPKPTSSNCPFPTTVHSQEIGTTRVGKMRPNFPEHDFLSPNKMDKGLTNISQLHQKEDKETSHKSDEELTSSAKEYERTIRNCKKKKEMDSEIHVPPKIHEHKKGCTPLHEAANEGFNDIIVELLKAGTNANCENIDGTLPLHEAVASNRLKAAETLPEYRAHPNEKDQKQKTAWDGADDDRMKVLLKSYGPSEADKGDESTSTVPVKIPAVQPKRYQRYACDGDKTVLPLLLHQTKRNESLSVHQNINAVLQDIEEKQEHLLEFEIRSPEDAEQYIEKMLAIKEAMDNVLAQQKAERDALAKKYRVSMESFKHGALREQLANLATRQKSLLVVAKKHKQIRLKIQNYKSSTSFSGLSLRKLPSSSHITNKKKNQELTSLENSVNPQSDSLSPVNLACKSMKETPLSLETWNDSQNTNICLNEQAMRAELSGNEMNSKQNDNDATVAECLKPTYCHGTEKMELSTQLVAFVGQAEYSQEGNDLAETTAIWHGVSSPPAATTTDTLTFSEDTNVLSQNYACPSTVTWDQDLLYCDLKRRHKGTDSQQPLREISESLAHQGIAVLGSDTVHQIDPCLNKTASAVSHASNTHVSSSSGSDQQQTIKKTAPYTTVPKKKSMQLKDLISLGRIDPGNVLEFKTKETTHKASILLSGKLKVENGQIYQNPVTWLKDLLGSDSHVTWNYAWNNDLAAPSHDSRKRAPSEPEIHRAWLSGTDTARSGRCELLCHSLASDFEQVTSALWTWAVVSLMRGQQRA